MQAIMQLMDLEKMRPEMDRIIPRRASSGPLWTKVQIIDCSPRECLL